MVVLKEFCLWVNQHKWVHRMVESSALTQTLVKRFVSGTTQAESLLVANGLVEKSFLVSLDYLGENNLCEVEVQGTVATYLELLAGLESVAGGGGGVFEVSVKPSAIGSCLLNNSVEVVERNAYLICEAAAKAQVLVTFDMEDHTCTDRTIGLVLRMRETFPTTGVVLQAYLRRTEQDCVDLGVVGSRIRLCKGSYNEPLEVAFGKKHEVDASYLRCLQVLFSAPCYPMVASHDRRMVEAAGILADLCGRGVGSYEYQMLFGVRPSLQKSLLAQGGRVRIYLPYGDQWYNYFMRRLLERPANLVFFVRSLFSR